MDQSLIQRYQSGGDIYLSIFSQHGAAAANAVANAALSGDERQINAVLAGYETAAGNSKTYTPPLDTSTLDAFGNQIVTDPLGAPFASANNLIGNSVLSFLKNPWVVVAVVVIIFGALGGFGWIGRKIFK